MRFFFIIFEFTYETFFPLDLFLFRPTESSFSSSFKNSFSSCDVGVRSHLPLYASNTNSKSNKRKKQEQRLKQKLSVGSSITPGRSLTEDELHSHLNSRINYGKDGPVGARLRSRGVSKKEEVEEESDDVEDKNGDDSRRRQQQFFLRQLTNRPTLVLNANYMVSESRQIELVLSEHKSQNMNK
jgi:hypothetical protein